MSNSDRALCSLHRCCTRPTVRPLFMRDAHTNIDFSDASRWPPVVCVCWCWSGTQEEAHARTFHSTLCLIGIDDIMQGNYGANVFSHGTRGSLISDLPPLLLVIMSHCDTHYIQHTHTRSTAHEIVTQYNTGPPVVPHKHRSHTTRPTQPTNAPPPRAPRLRWLTRISHRPNERANERTHACRERAMIRFFRPVRAGSCRITWWWMIILRLRSAPQNSEQRKTRTGQQCAVRWWQKSVCDDAESPELVPTCPTDWMAVCDARSSLVAGAR